MTETMLPPDLLDPGVADLTERFKDPVAVLGNWDFFLSAAFLILGQ